jgi:hypothetical protein
MQAAVDQMVSQIKIPILFHLFFPGSSLRWSSFSYLKNSTCSNCVHLFSTKVRYSNLFDYANSRMPTRSVHGTDGLHVEEANIGTCNENLC